MSKGYVFRSAFAPYILEFLKMKGNLVVNSDVYHHTLQQWDEAMLENGFNELYVTRGMVSAWENSLRNICDRTSYAKHTQLIQFLKYMCRLGIECFVPRIPKRPSNMYTPYVFTHEEMSRIMEAIDKSEQKVFRPQSCLICMPCLFRLLYSTGMRISEALNIKNGDVNFQSDLIFLTKTKNGKERIIPMNPELKVVLSQYMKYRDMMPVKGICKPERHLFVSGIGKPFTATTPYTFFKKILRQCGIAHKGKNQGPRVHDLRHTFAVHTLQKMATEGVDLYAGLPVLSVLLGHASVRETEWYLRLTREFYPEVIDIISSTTGGIFPDVDKNNMYYGKRN